MIGRRGPVLNAMTALLLPLAALLTSPLLARALGPAGRGEMSAVLAPPVLIATLAIAGVPEAITYFVARRPEHARTYVYRGIPVCLTLGVTGFAVIWAASPFLMRNYPEWRSLLLLVALTLSLNLYVGVLRGAAQGLGHFGLVNAERAVSVVIRVALLITFFFANALNVTSAVWITWATGLAAGLVYVSVLRLPRAVTKMEPGVLMYSLRNWSGSVAGVLVLRMDTMLLAILSTPFQLGLYVIAVAIAEVPQMVVGSLRGMLLARASMDFDAEFVSRATRLTVLLTCLVAVAGAVASPLVIPILFGADFVGAVAMTVVLLAAVIPLSVSTMVGAGLAAQGRPGVYSLVQFAVLAVDAVVVIWLVPAYGGKGAALASLLAYTVSGMGTCLVFSRTTSTSLVTLLVPGRAELDELRALVQVPLRRVMRVRS